MMRVDDRCLAEELTTKSWPLLGFLAYRIVPSSDISTAYIMTRKTEVTSWKNKYVFIQLEHIRVS